MSEEEQIPNRIWWVKIVRLAFCAVGVIYLPILFLVSIGLGALLLTAPFYMIQGQRPPEFFNWLFLITDFWSPTRFECWTIALVIALPLAAFQRLRDVLIAAIFWVIEFITGIHFSRPIKLAYWWSLGILLGIDVLYMLGRWLKEEVRPILISVALLITEPNFYIFLSLLAIIIIYRSNRK